MALSYHIINGRKKIEKTTITQRNEATAKTDRDLDRLGSR